jgi:hypothetical protein
VFTAPFFSNGSYWIVACVFVAARMCLLSRWPSMNVYSDFAIPAFGRYVTIFIEHILDLRLSQRWLWTLRCSVLKHRVIRHKFGVAGRLPHFSKYIIHHGDLYENLKPNPDILGSECTLRDNYRDSACRLFTIGFLIVLIFDPEEGYDRFLRNIGWLIQNYTALQSGRSNIS